MMSLATETRKGTAAQSGDDRLPLGVVPLGREPLSPQRLAQLTWCLVLLGLAARVIRYLLGFPLWQDEAYLCVNLLDRGYLELLNPLDHHQVCPVLFLWFQASVTRLLGFSEYTLRLFPLICSVAGLFLFRHVAARLLRGTALLLAVGIFAVGYPLVRYACEAKPYGCDMFASLVLVALAVEWWVAAAANRQASLASACQDQADNGAVRAATVRERNSRFYFRTAPSRSRLGFLSTPNRWLWALVVCVPFAVGLSYPTLFTAAGVSLAVAYGLWNTKATARAGPGGWLAWLGYNVVLLASFAAVYCLSVGPQSAAELTWMRDYWKAIFPPLDSAGGMLRWFIFAHTSELLQYPIGGARGASMLTTICCIAAVVVLWCRRQRWLILLCLAPLAPNLVAAFLWRYPYGGSVRFVLYMAPAVCLLAGLGAASLLVRRDRRGFVRGRPGVLVLFGLLTMVAAGSIARDFARPYRTRDVLRHRDFARWFWFNKEYDGEVACWEIDVAEGSGSPAAKLPIATLYVCNRRIYSPRHARSEPVAWRRISADRPLRLVRYGASNVADDEPAFERWLAEIRSRYDLVDQQRHTFPMHHKDRDLLYYDYVDLYEFVPKGQPPTGIWSSRPASTCTR